MFSIASLIRVLATSGGFARYTTMTVTSSEKVGEERYFYTIIMQKLTCFEAFIYQLEATPPPNCNKLLRH